MKTSHHPTKAQLSKAQVARLVEIAEQSLQEYFDQSLRLDTLPGVGQLTLELSPTKSISWSKATATFRWTPETGRPHEIQREQNVQRTPASFCERMPELTSALLNAVLTDPHLELLWKQIP